MLTSDGQVVPVLLAVWALVTVALIVFFRHP